MTPQAKEVRGLSPLHNRATCFVDAEFFGFGRNQPIVDIAVIKDKPNGETEYYESKIAVTDYEIAHAEYKALKIIGFTKEEWADAPPRPEVITHVWNMTAGCAWVGHNTHGDLTRLEADPTPISEREVAMQALGNWQLNLERLRHEIDAAEIPQIKRPFGPVVDTAWLARLMVPGLDGYRLEDLCRHFGIEEEGSHRAMGGAMRCREVFYRLIGRNEASKSTSVDNRAY